jgi:type I restriction enzyme S subunit
MRWSRKPISASPVEIIDGDRGKEYPKQSDFQETGYCLFLNTGNVRQDGFDFSNCQFISDDKDRRLRKGKLTRDDLVMTTRGTIGNVGHFVENVPYEQIRINSGMVIFRTDRKRLLPLFLYHFFRSPDFVGQTTSLRSGVAQPQLPIRDIRQIEVPLPDILIQGRIASILSTYDDLIENNRRRMALLEEAARQVYQEWFVRLRFPGYEHTRIVDGVPEGWERVCVPEIIDVNPRERVERGKEIWYVPMSSLSEVGMTVDSSGFEARTEHTAAKFRKNDVLLARITPCLENGKTAIVHFLEENEVACGSTEFIVLRGKRVSPYFTYCLARSYDFRENAIKSMVGSSGRQRVQTSSFEKFVLGLPPCSLLRSFDETARGCIEQIANLTKQNQKLRTARDLLLPKLMSGEITV